MAYLNVRDRRLETRIVYVGPPGAGKATNLAELGRRSSAQPSAAESSVTDDAGEIVALEWGAEQAQRFRDCQLFARVVAPRGAVSVERTRALLRDVDGVVLVVDATPSRQEENRAAAALLRDALATAKRKLPVIVQVNKTDAADARPAENVLSDLGTAWPWVAASAARGDGVVETLERALAGVLDAFREQSSETNGAVRTDGNPLLDALRQVLRDTVAEHVAELEARFVAQLDRALEIAALRKALVDESARTRTSVEAVRNTVASSVSETTRALAAHSGAIAALERRFVEESELVTKVDRLEARINRVREEVRAEVTRAVEAQARADREHLVTVTANLRRSVEQVGAEVKDVQKETKSLHHTMADEVRDVVIAHVVGVEELVRGSGEGINDVKLRVSELTEELKKKDKKGWFG